MSWRVDGAREFAATARRLRTVNSPMLKKRFYSGINRAAKPLHEAVRKSARAKLPRKGGLGRRVAESRMSTKRRVTGNAAGVRIVATSGYDIGAINRGRVRHLTFGHKPWVNQTVTPGFWTEPLVKGSPAVETELRKVIADVNREVQ